MKEVNEEELENFLYYLADKVCDCYKYEVSHAIERFLGKGN